MWLAGAGTGLYVVWAYDNTPGTAAAAPDSWPANDAVALATDRPTLVLLAHPQCFCTQATFAELAEVLARAGVQPRTYVLFLKPQGFPAGWTDTALWRQASALPGAKVMRDDEGLKARQFGAETSGQIVLYDAKGSLVFSGGITGSRGHAGDNPSRAALVGLLGQADIRQRLSAIRTAVFGCPLFASAS